LENARPEMLEQAMPPQDCRYVCDVALKTSKGLASSQTFHYVIVIIIINDIF